MLPCAVAWRGAVVSRVYSSSISAAAASTLEAPALTQASTHFSSRPSVGGAIDNLAQHEPKTDPMSSLLLPASVWTESESEAFKALRVLAPAMWVTGGWVRDKLLECTDLNPVAGASWQQLRYLAGSPPGDLDVLVDGVTARDFHKACRKDQALRAALRSPPHLVEANSGRPFDTVKLRLPSLEVDVTSLVDASHLGGRGDTIATFSSLTEKRMQALRLDAEHRDVTFNALFYDLQGGTVLDPSGLGGSDLAAGIVRMPHPDGAAASVQEDPVRFLRTLRFAARFGFSLCEELDPGLLLPDVKELLQGVSRGRVLYEVKKALLLHNRPSRFLASLGTSAAHARLHAWLFGGSTSAVSALAKPGSWASAVGRVRRLEEILLEGLRRGLLRARSAQWRGRRPDGPPPALLAPDWRKLGVAENDWAELLLAALLWSHDEATLIAIADDLKVSAAMRTTIMKLQVQARAPLLAAHAAPLGVHLLHAAVTGQLPHEFWDSLPCPQASDDDELPERPWR